MIKTWKLKIPKLTPRQSRRVYVYIPDSILEDPDRRYPVLYLFDGQNVFFDQDASFGKSWGMAEYLEQSQTQMIVAAVECSHAPNNGRLSEYSPFSTHDPDMGGRLKGRGKDTLDWFVHIFKPAIDRYFPTIPDREFTFVGGSSMGGLLSLYAITHYNRYFSRAACLSPSIWYATDQLTHMLRTAQMAPGTVVYMDYGSEEMHNHSASEKQFRAVTSLLLEQGVYLTSRIVPGGDHSEGSWQRQIPWFMAALLYDICD